MSSTLSAPTSPCQRPSRHRHSIKLTSRDSTSSDSHPSSDPDTQPSSISSWSQAPSSTAAKSVINMDIDPTSHPHMMDLDSQTSLDGRIHDTSTFNAFQSCNFGVDDMIYHQTPTNAKFDILTLEEIIREGAFDPVSSSMPALAPHALRSTVFRDHSIPFSQSQEPQSYTRPQLECIDPSSTQTNSQSSFANAEELPMTMKSSPNFKVEPTGLQTSFNPLSVDDTILKLEPSINSHSSLLYDSSPPETISSDVVCPSKDVCLDLPIFFPSIPLTGTKSRVETQIKLTFELGIAVSQTSLLTLSPTRIPDTASPSRPSSLPSSKSNSPHASPAPGSRELSPAESGNPRRPTHNRVGTYKFLRLPHGTVTKRRTAGSATPKREAKACDPDPKDTLQMVAEVVCCSSPGVPVQSCSSCRTREAKRTARKLAARVRPLQITRKTKPKATGKKSSKKVEDQDPEDQDLDEVDTEEPNVDGSILQFNCAELMDFSSGTVVLPMRITCYCRHHKEKVGFTIAFTLQDYMGRVVGRGSTPPILITDDHKSTNATSKSSLVHPLRHALTPTTPPPAALSPTSSTEEPQSSLACEQADCAPTRRRNVDFGAKKRRPKPYDGRPVNRTVGVGPGLEGRQGIVLALHPAHARSAQSARTSGVTSFTPSFDIDGLPSSNSNASSAVTSPTPSYVEGSMVSPSHPVNGRGGMPVAMVRPGARMPYTSGLSPPPDVASLPSTFSSPSISQSDLLSPQHVRSAPNLQIYAQNQQAIFHSIPTYPSPSLTGDRLPQPRIHRLIPSSGPTTGGIEITVLGSNFHPSLPLECIFGGVVASSTHRWSDNTLVCMLPPRATPGLVSVEFKNSKRETGQDDSTACFFTYVDESDRQLMELALQVVGLKMTGKIEEARNVAMRIVGNTNTQSPAMTPGELIQTNALSETLFAHHSFLGSLSSTDIETLVIKLLTLLDIPSENGTRPSPSASQVIKHQNATGQTLLHLAVFLALPSLVSCLLGRSIDVNARNGNGMTALHFAALTGWKEGGGILLAGGADVNATDLMGLTPAQRAKHGQFAELQAVLELHAQQDLPESESGEEGDDEAWQSDAGESDGGNSDASSQSWSGAPPQYTTHSHMSLSSRPESSEDESPVPEESPVPSVSQPQPQPTQSATPQVSQGQTAKEESALDDKQDTSFVERLQRTLPQGILPNMQIPGFPQLQLSDVLAAPWGVFPHIPVFPVLVPIPNFPPLPNWSGFPWPDSLSGEKKDSNADESAAGGKQQQPPLAMLWTAYDSLANSAWRAQWEKWTAQVTALQNASNRGAELPPYSPPAEDNECVELATQHPTPPLQDEGSADTGVVPSETTLGMIPPRQSASKVTRRVGYSAVKIPTTEVDSYHYRPKKQATKQDRMLVLFWIPILILGLAYAVYTTLPVALAGISRATKRILPQPLQRDQIQV